MEEGRREVVNGLTWARFEGHIGSDPSTRFVCYVVPGNPRNVSLLLAAPADVLADALTAFEPAARATEGAQNPTQKVFTGAELLPLVAIAAGVLLWNRRRKKASR